MLVLDQVDGSCGKAITDDQAQAVWEKLGMDMLLQSLRDYHLNFHYRGVVRKTLRPSQRRMLLEAESCEQLEAWWKESDGAFDQLCSSYGYDSSYVRRKINEWIARGCPAFDGHTRRVEHDRRNPRPPVVGVAKRNAAVPDGNDGRNAPLCEESKRGDLSPRADEQRNER